MTTTVIERETGAGRVVFADGEPRLRPTCDPPPGALAASASVISPGTEMRRMGESRRGGERQAGYMNIAIRPDCGEVLLAPEPHGAWMRPDHPRALTAPAGTALTMVAAARFQLIAAGGMNHRAFAPSPSAIVVGSGPVALGCCLELMRRRTADLTLLTSRDEVPFARDLGIRITRSVAAGSAAVVINATGRVEPGLSALAPGGTLGLLGTPDPNTTLSVLHQHRQGIAVIGMHELCGYDQAMYQHHYSSVLAWLAATFTCDLLDRWCARLRADQVVDHYRRLASGEFGDMRPISIVEWS